MTHTADTPLVRRARRSRLALLALAGFALLVPCAPAQSQAGDEAQASEQIRQLIAKYTAAADAADVNLASEVWLNSPDVSFIHPLGHAHGWEQVKDFYQRVMGAPYSERQLTVRDIAVHVYGDSAWSEFYWHFVAKLRSSGATVTTDGRETQIYRKVDAGRWALVHVHYSGMPPGARRAP